MSLSEEEVRHVARLARLGLTGDEMASLGEELSDILAYAEKIGEVATGEVPPTSHPYALSNVHQADEVAPSLPREEVSANAPQWEEERFRVPRIVGEEA